MFTGHQEVRIQEKTQCLAMGSVPAAITVVLQDEMSDTMKPGGEMITHAIVGLRKSILRRSPLGL
jgi:DNA replicative helicase MCM subunit Mcm2 (Cdc46/Mcm family)